MTFQVGDKVRFDKRTLAHVIVRHREYNKQVVDFVLSDKIHTVTKVYYDYIYLDNIDTEMLGTWKTSIWGFTKVEDFKLPEELFEL